MNRRRRLARRQLSRRTFLVGALGMSLSGFAACLSELAPEGSTPTAQVDPVRSPPPSTASPTPATTVTPASVNATRTPAATPSPRRTPTSQPTPIPASSPTPSPALYQSPLTGMQASEPPRRPLAVQIDNAPDARPQTGLDRADIVYETPTEVVITRYTAFFGTVLPDTIGPVRSVRMVALEVIPQHDGILVHSGGSIDMLSALLSREIPALHTGGNASTASWRDSDRAMPHNLYVSGPELAVLADESGVGGRSRTESLTFGPEPDGGEPSSGVTIPFTAGEVTYDYDSRLQRFRRILDGEAHRDQETGRQITADNVVLLYARFEWMDFADDEAGDQTLGVSLVGEGRSGLFRDGKWYDAVWRREDIAAPLRLFSALTDRELPLKIGTTWFAVIPQWLGAVQRRP